MMTKVNVGDLMCFPYWGKVVKVRSLGQGERELQIEGLDGNQFFVKGNSLIERSMSADQFDTTKKVTKTHIAEILIASNNTPFTVCFKKANGDLRVLRGKLNSPEPVMGRSFVTDMDIDTGNPLRQVDHRNIEYLIINNVKYVTK